MRRLTGTISADPDGAGTLTFLAVRNSYDQAGRLIKVENGTLSVWQSEAVAPAGWTGFTVHQTLAASYDAMGRKVSESLREGAAGTVRTLTQYSYDNLGRPDCTAVRMNPTAFASPPGACVLGTQGSGSGDFGPDRITRNFYDAAGQRLQLREAVGVAGVEAAEATWAYNLNGQVTTVIDGNGNRANFGYDGHARRDRWTFPSATRPPSFNDATQATATATAGSTNALDYEAYTYDAAGNRTSFRKRDNATIAYEYDALNRVTRKTVPERAGLAATHTRDVFHGYDLRGLVLSARFDGLAGEGITNVYNGFGQLTSSSNDMGGVARAIGHLYDLNGNRIRLTHPDGAFAGFDYDGLNRLKAYRENGAWQLATITYDNAGRRQVLAVEATATTYGYDNVSRLNALGHDLGGSALTLQDQTQTFAYNAASQMIGRAATNDLYAWSDPNSYVRSYAANGLNQYSGTTSTGASPVTFTYDANGNLISDGVRNYVYDIENRLVSASGGATAALIYDPLGRLFETSGGTPGVTRFLYDGDELALEYGATGGTLRRYLHGPAADDPWFWYEGSESADRRALIANHQGSIVGAVNPAGTAVVVNSFDDWGIPGANNAGRFGYTGQAWIPELGLWYYKARFYSPTLGRFLQTDPIGYDDQINLYAYVGNDPVNLTDPTGTEVRAIFYAEAGLIRVTDNDGGDVRWASAFSGGKSGDFEGGPVPGGRYAILEGPGDNSYRLERLDSHFGNDRTPEGRTDLRLHPKGTRSVGCITCHPGKGGEGVGEILSGTRTSTVTVEYRGRIPWKKTEEVRQFGTLRVAYGSNIRFDKNSMQVSTFYPGDKNHKPHAEYVCTVQSTGACQR